MLDIALPLVAYLLGSIPTGIVIARHAGIDVRAGGSGNIGATNVTRTTGNAAGLLTLAGDVGKGALAVALAGSLATNPIVVPAAALAAFLGHVFSIFLKFSGGKGVATGLGVMLVLAPTVIIAPILVFAIIFFMTRIVSIASLAAAWTVPVATVFIGTEPATFGTAIIIATVITLRHKDNISRLRTGEEPRFGHRDTSTGR